MPITQFGKGRQRRLSTTLLNCGRGFGNFCRRGSSYGRGHRRSNWRCNRFRAHLAANSAQGLHLGQALLFFVDADGDELDHRLGYAQTALELKHSGAIRLNGEQNVVSVVELAHHVGELAAAHLLDSLNRAAASRDGCAEAGNQLVGILFGHIGPNDEHNLIHTGHLYSFSAEAPWCSSPQLSIHGSKDPGSQPFLFLVPVPRSLSFSSFRLNSFIAAAGPCSRMRLAAVATLSSTSSRTVKSALRMGESR